MRSTLFVMFCTALAANAARLESQVIKNEITCRHCDIRLTHVVRLDSRPAGRSVSMWSKVARDSEGFYWVAPTHEPTVFVFDAQGRLVRQVGRKGTGPGEFASEEDLRAFPMPEDTVVIVDPGIPRATYFALSGQLVRTAPLPPAIHYYPIGNNRFIVNAPYASGDRIGLPLHIAGSGGSITLSFGAATARKSKPAGFDNERLFATGSNGTIWAHHSNSYVLEQWAADAKLKQRFTRDAHWFPPNQTVSREHDAPMDLFIGAHETPTGMWTVLRDVSENWREFVSSGAGGAEAGAGVFAGRPVPSIDQQHGIYDAVIEFLDLRRRSVVARKKFSVVVHGFIYDPDQFNSERPHVYSIRADPTGDLVIDVFELELVRNARSQ